MTFVNANVPLNAQQTRFLYAFGGYSRREANSAGFYRRALDVRNWPQIYPLGFLPEIQPTVIDSSATAGVRGASNQWSWTPAASTATTASISPSATRSTSRSARRPAEQDRCSTPARSQLGQLVANVDISRAFKVDALGRAAQRRVRRRGRGASTTRSPPASRTPTATAASEPGRRRCRDRRAGVPRVPAVERSRRVAQQRGRLRRPRRRRARVAAPRRRRPRRALQRLRQHRGRQADGARPARSARSSSAARVSTGFRAPSLGQSFFSSTATNFVNLGQGLVPVESLTLPVDSPPAQVLGAQPLKPENSTHASAGMVITPRPRLRHHRRLLPHRHRRPHRPLRQLHRRRDRGSCSRRSAPTARGSSPTRSTRGRTAST